jgi:hypothetical protein
MKQAYCLLHAGFLFGVLSSLKTEVVCIFRMSADFYRTARRHALDDSSSEPPPPLSEPQICLVIFSYNVIHRDSDAHSGPLRCDAV